MKELKSLDPSVRLDDSLSMDIRYADDTTLLSVVFDKLKLSTKELEEACKKWGMKINGAKCKIISPSENEIVIDGQVVEHVPEFVFLGSLVPDSSADVRRRIALAATAFGRLRKSIWNRRSISLNLKIRLYKALILPIATYASETWTVKGEDAHKLEVFEMRCLRAILGVTRLHRIPNEQIRKILNISNTISEIVRNKRLRWFGHVTRRPDESLVYQAYNQDFPNPRPKGRPPKRWTDHIRCDTGLPVATAERRASDRARWRRAVGDNAKGQRGLGT